MNILNDILPNPLSKDSTLVGLQKKGLLIAQAAIIPNFVRNIIFLLITGYILIMYLSLPVQPVLVVIGYEVLLSFIHVLISMRAYMTIKAVPDPGNNSGLYSWGLILKAAFYDVVKSLTGVVSSICLLFLLVSLFPDLDKIFITLPKVTIPALENISAKINAFAIVYIWIFSHLIRLFTIYIKYQLMKKLKMTDNFAENEKLYLLWKTKMEFITSIPLFSMFMIGFTLLGVPLSVISPFILIYLLILYFTLRQVRGLQSFSYDQNSQLIGEPDSGFMKATLDRSREDRNSSNDKNVQQDEEIKAIVYGVTRVASDWKGIFRVTGGGSFGAGISVDRENSLIITNNRFLLVEVPVTGGNTIVGDINYSQQNVFFNRKEIREKGEVYTKTTNLEEIIKNSVRNYVFKDINKVFVDSYNITLEFSNGDKYKCHYFDKEYRSVLQEVLTPYFNGKILFK